MSRNQLVWTFILSLVAFAVAYRVDAIGAIVGVNQAPTSGIRRAA